LPKPIVPAATAFITIPAKFADVDVSDTKMVDFLNVFVSALLIS
jgi:hypothetical protein